MTTERFRTARSAPAKLIRAPSLGHARDAIKHTAPVAGTVVARPIRPVTPERNDRVPRGDQRLPVDLRHQTPQSTAPLATAPLADVWRAHLPNRASTRAIGIGGLSAALLVVGLAGVAVLPRDGGPYREPASYGRCPDPAWMTIA
jgi:hypothetical protein